MTERRSQFAVSLCMMVLGLCSGYDYFNDDKRQDLVPFPRIGRSDGEWKQMEKPKGLIPFPRVGKRQELIPFPRVGRSFYDPDDYSEDIDQYEYFLLPYTKRMVSLRPRIGRKKRSIDESQSDDDSSQEGWESDYERTKCPSILSFNKRISECIEAIANRPSRAKLTPRIGRRDSIKTRASSLRPRIGRSQSLPPRIGRSRLEPPRIGRSDSDSNGFQ